MNPSTHAEGGLPLPISGDTRVYAIIGDPIGQVGSPRVFNTLFRERDVPAVLVPFHVTPDTFEEALRGFRAFRNVDGVIVTVPHKVTAAKLVDSLGDAGKRIGAVNAIRREPDGTFIGDNFDGKGCVIGLQREGHSLSGKRSLIIGAGGAGAAVAHAFADEGASPITIFDVDTARAEALAASIRTARPEIEASAGAADATGCAVVVNCSPLGMKPDDPYPVDPDQLTPDMLVVDVILKPRISRFLQAAEARGCATQPGYRMLEGQAEAIARFFGVME
ncbi:MAG: shikimate dehydrogenase [Silicimonas sp.]